MDAWALAGLLAHALLGLGTGALLGLSWHEAARSGGRFRIAALVALALASVVLMRVYVVSVLFVGSHAGWSVDTVESADAVTYVCMQYARGVFSLGLLAFAGAWAMARRAQRLRAELFRELEAFSRTNTLDGEWHERFSHRPRLSWYLDLPGTSLTRPPGIPRLARHVDGVGAGRGEMTLVILALGAVRFVFLGAWAAWAVARLVADRCREREARRLGDFTWQAYRTSWDDAKRIPSRTTPSRPVRG